MYTCCPLDGSLQWKLPLAHVEVPFGSGTSPVRAGELIILNRLVPKDPSVVAVDRRSGKIAWQVLYHFPEGMFAPPASLATRRRSSLASRS